MVATDTVFAGSIPALYDRYLGPLLFEPYAADLAERVAQGRPRAILETAAGTGIVTEALAAALPEADIVATDLNQAMLDVAVTRVAVGRATFQAADAQELPFADESFDAVVCQFGVMFFPDRVRRLSRGAPRAAARRRLPVQRLGEPRGESGPRRASPRCWPPPIPTRRISCAACPTAIRTRRGSPPTSRPPALAKSRIETVGKRSRADSAEAAAIGFCQGTPLRSELEARSELALAEATELAAAALRNLCGPSGLDAPMSAHVVTAST